MPNFLKNHPFAVDAYFERSLVVTFAIPVADLEPLLPKHLQVDAFDDKWGFVAVAMVQTKGLRPQGFPRFLGRNFFLIGYRIFVRYITKEGKRLRGLYILKSETDSAMMTWFGNIFTHYHYTTTDISATYHGSYKIFSNKSGIDLTIWPKSNPQLPEGSPFSSWEEARRFAGPLPFTFTFDEKSGKMLIVEGVRNNWKPKPVEVAKCEIDFFKQFPSAVPANAFVVENIPYSWKKGRVEIWK